MWAVAHATDRLSVGGALWRPCSWRVWRALEPDAASLLLVGVVLGTKADATSAIGTVGMSRRSELLQREQGGYAGRAGENVA